MGLAVLPPDPEEDVLDRLSDDDADSPSDSDNGDDRPSKRRRLSATSSRQIVLPGEVITDETQWMR